GGRIMKTLQFFVLYMRAMIATNLKAALALRASFLTSMVMMALNNIFFVINWVIFFDYFDAVRGWGLREMIVLCGIASTGFGMCVFFLGGSRELARLIDEGNLDTWLVQPKPVLSSALASKCQASGLGDILSGLGLLVYSGIFTEPSKALVVAFVSIASCLVFLGASVMVHSLAFWLGRTNQLSRTMQEFLILFGLYPGGIHRPFAKVVLYVVLPAGLFAWLPMELIEGFTIENALLLAAGTAAYFGFSLWVFSRGLLRYASGSSFAVVA
ncbi:MAG: ABC-2 family transporter protein, partial [Planctomycetes bacterium]|nr:ABC-2 family transporter protein [Planctomycetota bacterium]